MILRSRNKKSVSDIYAKRVRNCDLKTAKKGIYRSRCQWSVGECDGNESAMRTGKTLRRKRWVALTISPSYVASETRPVAQ